jgi:hypothetical protein
MKTTQTFARDRPVSKDDASKVLAYIGTYASDQKLSERRMCSLTEEQLR